jgi:hypothetical protein
MGYIWTLVATLRRFKKGREEPKMRIEICSVQIATYDQPFLESRLLYRFHRSRIEEIFLIFAWIHILQRGIWDIGTRKTIPDPIQELSWYPIQTASLALKTPGRLNP